MPLLQPVHSMSAHDQAGLEHRVQVKETVGGIMGSAEEATSDTASKAVDQVRHAHVWTASYPVRVT